MPIVQNSSILNAYFTVGDTNPGTHVFSTAAGEYVVLADSGYTDWLAEGNETFQIDTQANLYSLIDDYNQAGVGDITGVTILNVDTTLTNPMSNFYRAQGSCDLITLPLMNVPGSIPIGYKITIANDLSSTLVIKDHGGNTVVSLAEDVTIVLVLTENDTQAGTFDYFAMSQFALGATSANILTPQAGGTGIPNTTGQTIDFTGSNPYGLNLTISGATRTLTVSADSTISGTNTGDQTVAYTVYTSGSGTYSTPANTTRLEIEMIGGGGGGSGGGSGSPGAGGNGGDTTWDSTLFVAGGGTGGATGAGAGGAGGAVSGSGSPVLSFAGGTGGSAFTASGNNALGGLGGSSFRGGGTSHPGKRTTAADNSTANSGWGGGGGGATNAVDTGRGGGGGAYLMAIITSPAASYSYAVGAAGTAGTTGSFGSAGGAGGSGLIIVKAITG